MSVNSLPFGKTPEEAAHELTINLLLYGYFEITPETKYEEVFRLINNAEHTFSEYYLRKLNSINQDK
ncbi:hypothetical protein AIT68_004913 [Salmonella enterica subsp. salamae]|uniref:hypothetical protein n=1 Tax=Salmonella enterica TaxID=28901 RepID=UPI0009E99DC6|nr:hypothetical protein [Salmonella enterica]EBQ5245634.1 hypothetical protein [Salmonella enterica subsp. salamae]